MIPTATELPWYAGGTLHRSTVAEWRVATDINKLATAADWVTGGLKLTTIEEIAVYAPELLDCIAVALDTYAQTYSESAPMTDLVVACLIVMKTTPTLTPPAGSSCLCTGDLYNCGDFLLPDGAQACLEKCIAEGAGDIHRLDWDNDLIACEDPQ